MHRTCIKFLAFGVAALALSGCGALDVHQTRDPLSRSRIIGMALPDLLSSVGKPDAVVPSGPDTAVLQYDWTHDTAAFKAVFPLFGSLELGGGGGCRVLFTVLREGTVADVAFSRVYSNNLFSLPEQACEPLIAEPLAHPNGAGAPAGYDAWRYLFPEGKAG